VPAREHASAGLGCVHVAVERNATDLAGSPLMKQANFSVHCFFIFRNTPILNL
jgi:hypothetical protein